MNIYEIILYIWVTILTLIFVYFIIDMLDGNKKLKDTVDNFEHYFDAILDPQIKRIRQLVYDEIINKKENTNANEDIISRQAVVNMIKSMPNDNPSYWNRCDVVDRAVLIDKIIKLPSVTK